jgi:hypothetical protein
MRRHGRVRSAKPAKLWLPGAEDADSEDEDVVSNKEDREEPLDISRVRGWHHPATNTEDDDDLVRRSCWSL